MLPLPIAFFLIIFITTAYGGCPDGWPYGLDEKCFLAVEDDVSFSKAEDFCVSKGGHLVTVESAQENDVIQKALWKTFPERDFFAWIGFSYNEGKNSWLWFDGSSSSYTNWAEGYPSTNQPVLQESALMSYGNGKWISMDPGFVAKAVCQMSHKEDLRVFKRRGVKLLQ